MIAAIKAHTVADGLDLAVWRDLRVATRSSAPGDVVVSWSGGKDSALTLWELDKLDHHRVVALLTTVTDTFDRISMHGVRVPLLRQQAARAELQLIEVRIPAACSNDLYEERMREALLSEELRGCERYAFGDLFLEDVRAYREERLAVLGKRGMWPVWGRDTRELAAEFVASGFRAVVVCVDPGQLSPSFCGREFDDAFLSDLPPDVDPCGERGEFHTFVYDGPVFSAPIEVRRGEIVDREGFVFCDLVPNV